jgi:hypothetical protein
VAPPCGGPEPGLMRHAEGEEPGDLEGTRLLVCRLPSRSPWLNPIEPKWAHAKRAVAEPARKLSGAELKRRLCDHYRCENMQPLAQEVA